MMNEVYVNPDPDVNDILRKEFGCRPAQSDLISRQAAIDTDGLDEEIRCEMCRNPMHTNRGCDGNCRYDVKLYKKILQILDKRIKPLPSAQTDLSSYSDKLWKSAYERGKRDASEERKTGKWIPCSERLPNTNGIYIVTRRISDGFECRNITDACYFDGSDTWHDDTRVNHERKYLTDVLAWCELPEPYREDKPWSTC